MAIISGAKSVEVRTISDQLVEVVRELILSGGIAPDLPIRQDSLASQLKVSKIPLREALARLEQDGLVRSYANRGYFVRKLSFNEAEEIYALRLKLEPDTVAQACLLASDEEQEAASLVLEELDAAIANHTPKAAALHRTFHLALIRPCEKEITTDVIARLHVMADRYVQKHLEPKGRDHRAGDEHRAILDAWLVRDADLARRLLCNHLERTQSDLRKEISAQTADV